MAVNMLLSFAFYADDDLARYRAKMPCGRMMIDSGAFTASTIGTPVELDAYAEFLETWRGVWDHAVTLDVIGDPVVTRRNTRKLHQRGLNVMPVFTRGDRSADFDAMVRDSGYVCVGGGVGMRPDVLIPRLAGLQRRAEALGGGIHVLGLGNMNALRKVRPYSADASNVSSAFRYGTLVVYDGRQLRSVSMADTRRLRALAPHFKAQGVKLGELARLGRQPRVQEGRALLMRYLSVSYLCADEDTTGYQVPVPRGVTDTPGTHLYSAVTGAHLAPSTAELDTLCHDPDWSVPMWERYRAKHARHCRVPDQEGVRVGANEQEKS